MRTRLVDTSFVLDQLPKLPQSTFKYLEEKRNLCTFFAGERYSFLKVLIQGFIRNS